MPKAEEDGMLLLKKGMLIHMEVENVTFVIQCVVQVTIFVKDGTFKCEVLISFSVISLVSSSWGLLVDNTSSMYMNNVG